MNKKIKKVIIPLVLTVTFLCNYTTISFAQEINSGINTSSTTIIDPPSED